MTQATVLVPTPSRRRRANPLARSRRRLFLVFVLPAAIVYGGFLVLPSLYTVWISFNSWSGAGPMSFVGLGNYLRIFQDPVFQGAFVNTMLILFAVGGGTFLLSFVLMLVLRTISGRRFIRAVIFFPNIVSGVVLSIVWGFLFQQDGMINAILGFLGVQHPPAWLSENSLFMVIMVGLIWINTGFYTTILMAAVDRIPDYLFEECALAGANAWQRFYYVVLPLTRDVIGIAAVLWTISSIKIFEFIYAFAGGAGYLPSAKVWNTAIYSYAEAFASVGQPRYGTAAACAVVMVALVGIAVGLIRRLFNHDPIEL